jgi:peptidoglycan/xylan/chitin deacetylase (PgdA/CDA1 family)
MKRVFFLIIIFLFSFGNNIIVLADYGEENTKVPILLYHNIFESEIQGESTVHISSGEFDEHLNTLKSEGYNTITFNDYYLYAIFGKELPEKPIIITFDDGYLSNYEYAYPILLKYDMKATIFVITGRMGAVKDVIYPHFTWDQAKEMVNSGYIDIQSHSDFHKNMTELKNGELQLEFRRSKYLIEKKLGTKCKVFAYPYGLANDEIKKIGEKAGYDIQVVVGDEGSNTADDNITGLKRLTVKSNIGSQGLLELIENNI